MEKHIINQSATLRDALDRLNRLSGSVMTLLVIDDDGRMTGTLTDGDTRRGLLAGASLDDPVGRVMHREFRWLPDEDPIDVARLRQIRLAGIRLVPILDADRRLRRVIDTGVTSTVLPVSALLMAGGRGERLRPLTLTTPKPLLEIGGRAIIDYNIEALAAVGVNDITVTTNYLAEQIAAHFATPVAGVTVKTVQETEFLGTIGSAGLVKHQPGRQTIVMNSDLLTTISFEDLYLRHIGEQADITVAVVPYNVSVPYAVLETEGQRVTALAEKPSFSYYANAGIYMINNDLLAMLDGKTRVDATDFIEHAIAAGRRVAYFPINGTWIDIGNPVDFNHAAELMAHHNQLAGNNRPSSIVISPDSNL